jgi:hypothetical protein
VPAWPYAPVGKEVDYGKLDIGALCRVEVDVVDREWGTPNVRVKFYSRVTGVSRSRDYLDQEPLTLQEVRFENGVELHGSFGHGIRLYRTSRTR